MKGRKKTELRLIYETYPQELRDKIRFNTFHARVLQRKLPHDEAMTATTSRRGVKRPLTSSERLESGHSLIAQQFAALPVAR